MKQNFMMEKQLGFREGVFWSFSTTILLLLVTVGAADSDRVVLLEFKERITSDPFGVMSSWNDSTHFCAWTGVSCTQPSNRTVSILNLEGLKLVGSLPPSIGNLTTLTAINLRNNYFHGEIPQELGRLVNLQFLNLTLNSFTGKVPANLTHCSDLRVLDFGANSLEGSIPDELSSLTKLVQFKLGRNNLTGGIPPWLGNCSSLFVILLSVNNLHGEIPEEVGQLSKLGSFQVFSNQLSGTVPSSIFNVSSIFYLSVSSNQLTGSIPPELGFSLPNLVVFATGANGFTGKIPFSLSNISGLEIVDFSQNSFTGALPMNLERLTSLTRLYLGTNQLRFGKMDGLHLLSSMTNCTNLEVLGLEYINLGGELPESIGNLSTQLKILTLGGNGIRGVVPAGIGNLVNLTTLGLEGNLFTGNVPFVIGKLDKLERLDLNVNKFSGLIPSSIGNLSLVSTLFMEMNRFEGNIPPSLGNCTNLRVFNLSYNNLNGTIPRQMFDLPSLTISFSVAHNSLIGPLPSEVGNLKNLEELELSNNRLSGTIPSTLANILSLEHLYLGGNLFQGTIPESLSALRGIQEIDLSRNNLSGKIPSYLEKLLSLKYLNLSFNDFEDEVPKEGIFANITTTSVNGNHKLCGGIPELRLPICSRAPAHISSKVIPHRVIVMLAFGCLFVFLLSLVATYYLIRNLRNRKQAAAPTSDQSSRLGVSYAKLFKSTDGFSEDNFIGKGSFGSVYKGFFNDIGSTGMIVAVKVLNLQQVGAYKSFLSECEALRNIRHRNLVNIITSCSSIDYKGNEFKALVYDFMSNGDLHQWLHPQINIDQRFKSLNLRQRLSIAIDVASALEYLHHHCETPIVHCDLKPSNVLLDDDMTARLSDFGLARFLLETTDNVSTTQSVGLKGSMGYIPPEYGMGGQVSVFGDIYSYGILLLEMFTGKRPTDDMFKDGLTLHDFAKRGLPDRVLEIVDPALLLTVEQEDEDEEEEPTKPRAGQEDEAYMMEVGNCGRNTEMLDLSEMQKCLISVIRIGISCSVLLPSDRVVMKDVVKQMHDIRKTFLKFPAGDKKGK